MVNVNLSAATQAADRARAAAQAAATGAAVESLQQRQALTESQAAKLIGVRPETLRAWRYRDKTRPNTPLRKAPPHETAKNSRGVQYPLDALMAWINNLPRENGVPQLVNNRAKAHLEHYGKR